MGGIGPITNTRTLKGALVETIGRLERSRQKPVVVRLLQRCRDYRELVDEWDSVSPPPDEQFETIGQIMQLLGAAMQEAKKSSAERGERAEPILDVRPIAPLGDFEDDDDFDDVVEHEHPGGELELDLVPASPCAEVVELYRKAWRSSTRGVQVKLLKSVGGRHHALVRLEDGAELPGQKQDCEEVLYVLDGCVKHAGELVHAGSCLRIDSGSKSGTIRSVGETTLMVLDSERRAIAF